MTESDYVGVAVKGLDIFLSILEAARAANDDAAVAKLEAALADSSAGQRIVALAVEAREMMAAGRAKVEAALVNNNEPTTED